MSTPSRAHAARYADLVRLLMRHGRADLVSGAGLDEFMVDEDLPSGDTDKAAQLADDLEAMGPTYIKLGQLLSTRFDLLPPAYTTALTRLQDSVEPFPFEEVREIVETELGAGLRHLFDSFDETPVAAASLGQVHRARTRAGREVVVKVQRPGIRETVRDDMEVLEKLANLADSHTGAGRRFGFARLLAQFRRSLAGELDYTREARNLDRFRELTADYEHLVVPEPLHDLSTSKVLTMEYLEGRKVTEVGPLGLLDVDARPLVEELFACYLRMILDAGVLHADPHPGNLLLTPDGRIALLDLGMVATVPPRIQTQVVKLLLAISDGDGEETAVVLASMGHPLPGYDAAEFREDVSHLVSSSVEMGGDLQAGSVLVELSRLSGVHGLRPPAEMAMIGKALLNLDQATLHLDPTFSPAEAIRDNASNIMRGGLSVSPGGIMAAAIEAKEFTSQLPRRANRILDALADGELTVRINAIDEERLLTVLQRLANRLTMGLVLAAIVIGAALMMQVPTRSTILGYPAIAMVFFVLAALGGATLVVWIVGTDRRIARQARRDRVERG
jgi:predicted unusual protein kinase regulating ubiquinone biosynthesis (AarF/ABC1/UbiB family)